MRPLPESKVQLTRFLYVEMGKSEMEIMQLEIKNIE